MPRDVHSLAATIVPSERLHCADCKRVAVGEQVDDQADQPDQFTAEYEQPPYCAATSLAAGFAPEQLTSGTVVPRGSRLHVTERVRVAFAEQDAFYPEDRKRVGEGTTGYVRVEHG